MKRLLMSAATVAALLCTAPRIDAAPMVTVAFSPLGGHLVGGAGQTVTLSYEITNTSDNFEWLLALSVDINDVLGLPLPGTFDGSVFDFPTIAPGATVTGALLDFTFDGTTPVPATGSGTIDFVFGVYDGDPGTNGQYVEDLTYGTGFRATKVPEPMTLALLGLGGAAAVLRRRRA